MKRFLQSFFVIGCLTIVTACIPARVDNRGHVDAFDRVKQIEVGKTTREEVQQLLGSPSTSNNFGDETWYYIRDRKEAVAFLDSEITQQQVTRIIFNQEGIVSGVEGYGLKDSQNIEVAKEVTPTEGQELGFFEQILGNVGRFNAGDNAQRNQPIRR